MQVYIRDMLDRSGAESGVFLKIHQQSVIHHLADIIFANSCHDQVSPQRDQNRHFSAISGVNTCSVSDNRGYFR